MLLHVQIALVSGLDLFFYTFPVALEKRRRKWIVVERRKGRMPAKYSRIHGDHGDILANVPDSAYNGKCVGYFQTLFR